MDFLKSLTKISLDLWHFMFSFVTDIQGVPEKVSIKDFYFDLFTASIHSF